MREDIQIHINNSKINLKNIADYDTDRIFSMAI